MACHAVTGEVVATNEAVHTDRVVSTLCTHDRKHFVTIARDMLVQTWAIDSLAKADVIRLKGFYVEKTPKFAAINTARCVTFS